MKKAILLQATLCCLFSFCMGQGVINNYPFGYGFWPKALMDFPNNQPSVTVDTNITLRMMYTHANISDTSGNLLMYTNGVVMIDGNHDTMPNGKGLNPCPYTTQVQYDGISLLQADLILPDPSDPDQYYLIHQSLNDLNNLFNTKLYYSKVNMVLNNGKGDLVQKNVILLQDTFWAGGTTACKHANGRDWWIIVLKHSSSIYFTYLLTTNGISLYSIQSVGSRLDYGQASFSPNGNFYGMREFRKNFQVYDFDRCTGILSNARFVITNDSNWGFGFCFSSDSKLAYAASAHYLYQANLDSVDLTAGTQVVANWDSTYDPIFGPPVETGFEFMQNGPDGKIYMTTVWATHFMQHINYPDSVGLACDMQQHSIPLPTPNGNTIPNFVNYFLGPVVGSICDSLGLGVPENALHDFKFTIQPNPVTDKVLHCKYLLPQSATGGKPGLMEISDITGRTILKEPLPQWSTEQHIKINVSPGIYLVKLKSNFQQVVKKIVVP